MGHCPVVLRPLEVEWAGQVQSLYQVCFHGNGRRWQPGSLACVPGRLRQHAMLQLRGEHLPRQAVSGVHRMAQRKLRPWQGRGQRGSEISGNNKYLMWQGHERWKGFDGGWRGFLVFSNVQSNAEAVLLEHCVCVMMMSWCLMSSDVIWHIRDKLWPMPKHGSIKSTYVRCMRV